MDQSSAACRNMMMEGSQLAGDRHKGDHNGVDEQKETSEGDYEEIEIFSTHHLLWSTTCHTLQLHELLCRLITN